MDGLCVETALTLAYGSKGVPLSYVIRAQEAPDLNGFSRLTWEESAVIGTPLVGLNYHADLMTVHIFILDNIGLREEIEKRTDSLSTVPQPSALTSLP